MMRPVRRIAFFGYLGSGNIGNDASLETVMGWLNSNYPQTELSCISIAPLAVSTRYGIPSVPMTWHSPNRRHTGVIETPRRVFGRLLDIPRSYMLAGSVDTVVVPGMGVLEDCLRVRPWNLPLGLLLIAAACWLRRRPFVLLDVGAERASNPITRWLYVTTVRLAAHVSYRDQLSAARMANAGARKPYALAPDLAFAHPASTLANPEPGRIVVGVMAYYGKGDDPVRGAHVRRRYIATMAKALAQLAEAGDQVVMVGGDRVDIDVAREIRAAMLSAYPALPDDAVLIRDFETFTELTEEMMRAEVVIASRFHNLICALRLGRPTVSVGYAAKNRYLMEVLDVERFSQEIMQLDADQLVAQVRAAREKSEAVTALIRGGTVKWAEEVECLLERVATETLCLPARQSSGRPKLQDEMNAWQSI
jgi:polysaccharide pyruvyl transferase WcaK-like protein